MGLDAVAELGSDGGADQGCTHVHQGAGIEVPNLSGKTTNHTSCNLREAGDDDDGVVGGPEPVEDGEADEHGQGRDEGAGGEVPGVVRHPPAEQPLHIRELEGALPNVGHHVHQHGEHHHNKVGASVARPWFEGHLKALNDMLGVDHVQKRQLLPLDQLVEVPEAKEEEEPAGHHDAKADGEDQVIAAEVIQPSTKGPCKDVYIKARNQTIWIR